MTALTITSSTNVTTLDTLPLAPLTSGQGSPSAIKIADDMIAVSTGMEAQWQAWRMCRIPTNAIIKKVEIYSDAALDSSTSQALALDVSVQFSDSTADGTSQANQNQLPTDDFDGSTEDPGAYVEPNKMFGTFTMAGNNVAIADVTSVASVKEPIDITFNNGLVINNYLITQTPIYKIYGFVDGSGVVKDPGGYFNMLFVVSTASATAHAGNFYCRVTYAVGT